MADIVQANGATLTPMEMQIQMQAIERQRAIANALQQTSMQAPESQMVSGHYVAPSGMQYLAKLAQGLIGKNQQVDLDQKTRDIATAQGNMMRDQFGIGAQPSAPSAPQASMPQAIQTGLEQGAQAGSVGPTNDNLQRVATALQSQPQASTQPPMSPSSPQVGSRVIPGMNPAMAFQLYNTDPKAYDAAYLKQFEPTELQRNDKYLGIDAGQSRTAELAKRAASGAVVNRGYGILTTNPITGKLENDPASMEGIDKAKAIEGKYDQPITLKTSSGQEIQLSKPEWADYQKTGNLPLRFLPPEARQALQSEADKSGQPAAVNLKTDKGMVSGQIEPKGVGQIGVSQTPFNQALDKDEATRVSKMTEDIYDKGTHAIDKVAQNNKMIELLPQVTNGPLNKQITLVKNLASSLGADIGDPAPNQEFEKYAVQGALSAAKQIYGSRITNQDVTTQIMSNPGATMTEKAIYQMLKYDNEIQQRNIQKMTALGEYRRGGGDPREFPVYFAQKYPFQGVSAPESGSSQNFKVDTPALPAPAIPQNRPPLDSIIKVR